MHDNCEFKKGSCVAIIDTERRHNDFSCCDATNDFATSNKRSSTVSGLSSSDCVAHASTSTKATRCADATLNPNYGVLNIYLVKDPNHFPKDDARSETIRRYCALFLWAT